jgi:hypothetical protein
MHLPVRLFLALCLAHLLGDFPFQPNSLWEQKKSRWWAVIVHGSIHLGLVVLCLAAFASPVQVISWPIIMFSVLYVAVHLLIDVVKQRLFDDSMVVLSIDQALHFATIIGLTLCITKVDWQEMYSLLAPAESTRDLVLTGGVVYTLVVFASGYVIRYMTRSLVRSLPSAEGEPTEQLRNAGLYIGWLERLLIITAVVLRSPTLIGLILTGKSIARFPEMKEPKFAEYFLIGTLLSVSIAFFGGLLLLKLWHGTVSLQP